MAKARGLLGERRVGHAGTLDPDATGVLLLGVGSVTRLLRFLTAWPKTYTAEVVLGVETSTLDASGEVTATHPMTGLTLEEVRAAAARLTGEIDQVPPMVSAVKVGGQRLHALARQGVEVEREPRRVTVHRFEVEPTDDPLVVRIEVHCSSGTYVRSLAADLGRLLGGGAHLRRLRRTQAGPFTEAEARPLAELELLPPREAWRGRPTTAVGPELAARVAHGAVLAAAELGVGPAGEGDGPWGVVDEAGELLAVYEHHPRRAGELKPAVVLTGSA